MRDATHLLGITIGVDVNCESYRQTIDKIMSQSLAVSGKAHWFCEGKADTPNLVEAVMLVMRSALNNLALNVKPAFYALEFLSEHADYHQLALFVIDNYASRQNDRAMFRDSVNGPVRWYATDDNAASIINY